MANKPVNNIKLGAFVLAGLIFLVLLMYLIGKNRSLFGSNYELRARFENVQGLVSGNNVRYAGIEAGTVKRVKILNDTTIEVTMLIEKKMNTIIRKNAIVSIGTEGIVGNKVVNIIPAHQPAELAEEGDLLVSKKSVSTDEMLNTLNKTNNDIAYIAGELKVTVNRINNSMGLWKLLNDESIPNELRASIANIRKATNKANLFVEDLHGLVADVRSGKGSVGSLLTDTAFAHNLNLAVVKIQSVVDDADSLAREINSLVAGVKTDVKEGKGAVYSLLRDSTVSIRLSASLENIQKGTDGFNQNMEALKHSFLFRGYFRKLEKQKKREAAQKDP